MDRGNRRSWWRRLGAAALAIAIVGTGCNRAFRAGTGSTGGAESGSLELSFAFADGSSEATVVSGGLASVEVALPSQGFRKVVDTAAGSVDPTRLAVAASVDLGDPQAGGYAAGSDVAAVLAAAGRLHATRAQDGRPAVAIDLAEGDLAPFPFGRMLWSIVVLDDIDRATAPLYVGLTVRAPDRPTATLALEIPPFGSTVPTGVTLPLDDEGVPFCGKQLDFVLSLRAIPNSESGARFDRLFPNGLVDPERISLVADRNLGDPGNGGLAAGENLAPLLGVDLDLLVDEATGETIASLLFPLGASWLPLNGDTTFTASLLDDADVLSLEGSTVLRVVAAVTLSGDIQPILSSRCATSSCHDNTGPAAGLRLTNTRTFGETVRVRADQTPDDSCATLRIAPYDPEASYLWRKVNDTHRGDCAKGSGNDMPPTGSLTAAQLAKLESWMVQGAHDN